MIDQTQESQTKDKQKEALEQQLREIYAQIKDSYQKFLMSLQYHNLSDRKDKMRKPNQNKNQSIYLEHQYSSDNFQELINKQFRFEDEMSIQNEGYLQFIRLSNALKNLQKFNHKLTGLHLQKCHGQDAHAEGKLALSKIHNLRLKLPAAYNYTPKKQF